MVSNVISTVKCDIIRDVISIVLFLPFCAGIVFASENTQEQRQSDGIDKWLFLKEIKIS